MQTKVILLVEDNPDDELLTLRALRKANLANRIMVARDGAEALDYLFGKDVDELPALVLLDLLRHGLAHLGAGALGPIGG